jgi:hypothetical protein
VVFLAKLKKKAVLVDGKP